MMPSTSKKGLSIQKTDKPTQPVAGGSFIRRYEEPTQSNRAYLGPLGAHVRPS